MESGPKFSLEKDTTAPLAVIFGESDLATAVVRALKKQRLRVLHLEEDTSALPIFEHPSYVLFFVDGKTPPVNLKMQFQEAVISAIGAGAKIILVLDNALDYFEKTLASQISRAGWPLAIVEVRGEMDGPAGAASEEAAGKIVRLAFSHSTSPRLTILGKNRTAPTETTYPVRHLSAQDVFDNLKKHQRRRPPPWKKITAGIFAAFVVLGIISPLLVMGAATTKAIFELSQAKNQLTTGQFTSALKSAESAKRDLGFAKIVTRYFGPAMPGMGVSLEKYYDFLTLGETGADVAVRAARLGPRMDIAAKGLMSGGENISALSGEIRTELGPLNDDLGLIEAQAEAVTTGPGAKIMAFFGMPTAKIKKYADQIPLARQLITQADSLLVAWPEVVPATGKKTYLVVFQNSAELRPTGGFIGSYALVKIDNGRLQDWKIYDIYTADGLLRGTIAPPDEILHFLGQQGWFMRDANWAADFPLTAKRLLWFLEKETGQTADGVVAVNLGAVQKLLEATGPLALSDFNQTVSAGDFFQKAEFSSEINFFAGSTQKRDFLGAVAKAILEKMTADTNKNYPALASALVASLNEKDILLYFNSREAQKAALSAGWSGTVEKEECLRSLKNCLMLVEANLGANKANYFVKRSLRVDSVISKGGDIENTVTVLYRNDSPSDTWPGGAYKNYLRFLIPRGSRLVSFDLGSGQKPIVSPVLTAAELARISPDEFFVFQSKENNFDSIGTLVEIPIETDRTIVFRYRLPSKMSFANSKSAYDFFFLKQPGTNADLLDFSLDYPSFLTPVKSGGRNGNVPLVFNQKLIYNSDLGSDRSFEINFETKL